MSVFKLPRSFCDELRSIVSRFWWGAEQGKRKIPWISWDRLCKPKGLGGLGFRDYHKFNLALLGKQSWRLMTNGECLMVRVLRAKYFPGGSYMQAELGRNPSFTWRGIWEARKVMENGLCKRIGNGLGTRVWKDPWLLNAPSRKPLSPCPQGGEDTVVADLLTSDGTRWDTGKVRANFLPFEQEHILNMEVRYREAEDAWFWGLEKDGTYTVRSAYRAMAGDGCGGEGPSDWSAEKRLWRTIWQADVLPRVKTFFWQLCNDALPTKGNIAQRISLVDACCPVCQCEMETCLHLVKGCGWLGGFWDGLGVESKKEVGHERVREWVEDLWQELGVEERERVMVGCWGIWEARNKWVFDGKPIRSGDVISRVMSVLAEGVEEDRSVGEDVRAKQRRGDEQGKGSGLCSGDERRQELRWQPPGQGLLKINCDAGAKTGLGVGLGAVCRDEDGGVRWALKMGKRSEMSAREAEAEAILEGTREALRQGHREIEIESDCKEIIDILKDGADGRSPLFSTIAEIRHLSTFFMTIRWSFVNRKCNRVAHELAQLALSSKERRVCKGFVPSNIDIFVSLDRNDIV